MISRRFGIEIEICSFDGKKRTPPKELPKGIDYVAFKLSKFLQKRVEICDCKENHDNTTWIVKIDNSCGMEISPPILKGGIGLKTVYDLVCFLKQDPNITSNTNCAFHVHVNINDLNKEQIGSVVAHWIKCEPVILDSMPFNRQMNRYCQMIGMLDFLKSDFNMSASSLIKLIGEYKYYSLNAYHYYNMKRRTLEFRTMGHQACIDPNLAIDWIRFVLHFVEITSKLPIPQPYDFKDHKTGLCWLDPKEVIELLNLDKYLRDWFISNMYFNSNCYKGINSGFWSKSSRVVALEQINDLYKSIYNK